MAQSTKAILQGSIVNPQVANKLNDLIQDSDIFKELAEKAPALEEIAQNLEGVEPSEEVAPIAEPETATAEDIADKVNEIISAMKASGLMK